MLLYHLLYLERSKENLPFFVDSDQYTGGVKGRYEILDVSSGVQNQDVFIVKTLFSDGVSGNLQRCTPYTLAISNRIIQYFIIQGLS